MKKLILALPTVIAFTFPYITNANSQFPSCRLALANFPLEDPNSIPLFENLRRIQIEEQKKRERVTSGEDLDRKIHFLVKMGLITVDNSGCRENVPTPALQENPDYETLKKLVQELRADLRINFLPSESGNVGGLCVELNHEKTM